MKNDEMEKNPFLYLINLSKSKIKTNDNQKQSKEKNRPISPIKLLKFTKSLHKPENNKEFIYSPLQTAPNMINNNNIIDNKKQIKNNHSQKKIKSLNHNNDKIDDLKKKLKDKENELNKEKKKSMSIIKENIILKKGIKDYKNKIESLLKDANLETKDNDLYNKIINVTNIIIQNLNDYSSEINGLSENELIKLNNKYGNINKIYNKKKNDK